MMLQRVEILKHSRFGIPMLDLFQFGNDEIVIVWIMRKNTFRTTLDILRYADVLAIAAAIFFERIERTITKQAVETGGRDIFMTRKIATFRVCKKIVTVFHKNSSETQSNRQFPAASQRVRFYRRQRSRRTFSGRYSASE